MKSEKKYIEMVHYVINKCKNPSNLGATKLNKILWFSDTFAYRSIGVSISGCAYEKRQHGPVPRGVVSVLDQLVKKQKIAVKEPDTKYAPREFVSLSPPDTAVFSDDEREILDIVIDEITENHTAKSISDLSHDAIWNAANIGEEIPLFAVFAVAEEEPSDKDFARAMRVVKRVIKDTKDHHHSEVA
ncbi:MAG: Panacea domain-containing protein [Deltaproteobacteria bacterium]|nr:Panacea domain-containing protein [Deltaproteobacteria bacterium]